MTEARIKQLSSWSMFLSMLCAVHCALMPVLILAVSFSGSGLITNPFWEVVILGSSLALAGIALGFSYRTHSNALPLSLFAIALLLAVPGIVLHLHVLTIAVSIISAVALALNWKISKRCAH